MFHIARLKLTAWYLLIIVLVSSLFSLVIYTNVANQIEGLIRMHNDRLRNFQFRFFDDDTPPPFSNAPPIISTQDLENQKHQLVITLVIINLGILALAGGAGYFLAGQTLNPIKIMIDEQNQFISDASHELRTPIATLRAEMEGRLLEKHISDQQARILISSNLEELNTLQALSDNLLKLTQVHSVNNGNINKDKISLPEIIDSACNRIKPLAKKKNIDIKVKIPEIIIKGNKNSLTDVFVILLDNAIKYSGEHSKIIISSKNTAHKIVISVSDQGPGISGSDLPHIFERFFRADKSRSLVEGYGLGLSIAKKIVEDHQGMISVKSIINKGSTFSVELPQNNLKLNLRLTD